jgi:hypothetical protein
MEDDPVPVWSLRRRFFTIVLCAMLAWVPILVLAWLIL